MWYLIAAALVVGLDQLSKTWILGHFELYEVREIIPDFFNLAYVTNTGAAFSFLSDVDSPLRHWFFLGVGGLAVLGMTYYNYSARRDGAGVLFSLALGGIAGGALGNIIDRLRYGAVTDFLDFYCGAYHWPTFNVADSFICVGAAVIVVCSFFQSHSTAEPLNEEEK